MGENDETKNEGEKTTSVEVGDKAAKAAADGVGRKDDGLMTVVLKLDLHCEGCAKKVRRSISHLEGVEKAKADWNAKKLTVMGNVDPLWLRERVESKTKKKVELVSPQPINDGGSGGAAAAGGGDKKVEEKHEKKTEENKTDDIEKPKEVAFSSVVMKTKLHCDGCAYKVKRIILKNFDGVDSVTTDLQKDLITVIGTMDAKDLTTYLREKLKRGVDIVPPKKGDADDEKEKGSGGGRGGAGGEEKKEKENGGSGDERKESSRDKTGGETKPVGSGGEETKIEVNKMEFHSDNPQTYYAMPLTMYNQSYGNHDCGLPLYPPPPPPTYLNMDDQMFSDENPNGCFVM